MRVAKEERIRKETALEALESALKQRGRLRRPRRGTTGWKAIEQAICWWKGNDNWLDLPRDVQDIDLRTATAWRTYRQKGVGIMSKDVDAELLAEWTEALYYMIGDDKYAETSIASSSTIDHNDDTDSSCSVAEKGSIKELNIKNMNNKQANNCKGKKQTFDKVQENDTPGVLTTIEISVRKRGKFDHHHRETQLQTTPTLSSEEGEYKACDVDTNVTNSSLKTTTSALKSSHGLDVLTEASELAVNQ